MEMFDLSLDNVGLYRRLLSESAEPGSGPLLIASKSNATEGGRAMAVFAFNVRTGVGRDVLRVQKPATLRNLALIRAAILGRHAAGFGESRSLTPAEVGSVETMPGNAVRFDDLLHNSAPEVMPPPIAIVTATVTPPAGGRGPRPFEAIPSAVVAWVAHDRVLRRNVRVAKSVPLLALLNGLDTLIAAHGVEGVR
jgi:hypothetical protein